MRYLVKKYSRKVEQQTNIKISMPGVLKAKQGSWCAWKRISNEKRVLEEFRKADGSISSSAS